MTENNSGKRTLRRLTPALGLCREVDSNHRPIDIGLETVSLSIPCLCSLPLSYLGHFYAGRHGWRRMRMKENLPKNNEEPCVWVVRVRTSRRLPRRASQSRLYQTIFNPLLTRNLNPAERSSPLRCGDHPKCNFERILSNPLDVLRVLPPTAHFVLQSPLGDLSC